ncbi:MAG TPA: hypothetical protein PKA20_18550, partial [Burkholderiaceae bacterium]|nr:hypothetical protein [Burkholderiaceae bacterium]
IGPAAEEVKVHGGAVLAALRTADGRGLLTGGDDGLLARIDAGGKVERLADRPRKWIDQLPNLAAEWVKTNEAKGLPARKFLESYMAGLRKQGISDFLLPGDLERAQERRLLELHPPADLKADVLFVPHHGSATSSSLPFLRAVDPSIAVFQVGYRNRFRHPDAQVLARYQGTRARLLRSDAHGAIRIVLKAPAEPSVWRSRIDEPRYWRVPVAG